MQPELTLVIPAFNEAARLQITLPQAISFLEGLNEASELIVVDDGSTDETAAIAEAELAKSKAVATRLLRYETNRGKGHAVRFGLLAASAEVAIFSDADLSTPLTETSKVVDPIRTGKCDVSFGSRALDRSLIGIHQPWRREQGGRLFNFVVRVATGLPFWDTQCGFKAFRMSVCRPLIEAAKIDRFGFDVELIYLAHLAGLHLCEIPVRWNHASGGPLDASGNYTRDSLRMINEVRSIRRDAASGVYDAAIQATKKLTIEAETRPSGTVRI
jgi:dolichyl-phosphate beta-glucosyltransferase